MRGTGCGARDAWLATQGRPPPRGARRGAGVELLTRAAAHTRRRGHKLLNNASNAQTLMCFVLFEEAKNAQQAISLLQGQELMSASGSKSEITIEMARRSLQLDDVR